jgi:hypothetical protein
MNLLIWFGTLTGAAITTWLVERAGCAAWVTFACGFAWLITWHALDESFVRWPLRRAFILSMLDANRPLTGLELVKASGGLLRRGVVYVLLERLEVAGLIASRIDPEASPENRGQRLYSITSAGRAALWSDAEEGAER